MPFSLHFLVFEALLCLHVLLLAAEGEPLEGVTVCHGVLLAHSLLSFAVLARLEDLACALSEFFARNTVSDCGSNLLFK